ncbi:MAG: hypothetical protein R3349_08910 [Geminicoccaceae bacterium]|nr:hypothetical protein [Geminicoccaceae bacterium]
MRLAENAGVPRDSFLRHYRGNELDPEWLERVGQFSEHRIRSRPATDR